MKQHITAEQLEELGKPNGFTTPAGKLIKWQWKKNIASQESDGSWSINPMSIGQMIGFLLHEVNFNLDYSDLDGTWGVILGEKEYGNKELCDALWEAVKEVLNEKN